MAFTCQSMWIEYMISNSKITSNFDTFNPVPECISAKTSMKLCPVTLYHAKTSIDFSVKNRTAKINHRRAVAQTCVNGNRLSEWRM